MLKFYFNATVLPAFLGFGVTALLAQVSAPPPSSVVLKDFPQRSSGWSAYQRGDWREAQRLMEGALTAGARLDPRSYGILADSYYRNGSTSQSLAILQQARRQWANDAGLASLQTRVAKEDQLGRTMTHTVESGFDIQYPRSLVWRSLRSTVLPALTTARSTVSAALHQTSANTVPVVLYPSIQEYSRSTGAPAWSPAHYDGKIRLAVDFATQDPKRLRRVLTHEMTHCVVDQIACGHCPAWLHEGIAQLVETGGTEAFTNMIKTRLRDQVRRSATFDLAKAEHTAVFPDNRERTDEVYMEGYLVSLTLLGRLGAPGFTRMFNDLASGVPFVTSLKRHTGMTYAMLQSECWKASRIQGSRASD